MLAIKEDERQAIQLELNREKERSEGLVKNLNKLEGMLHDLQELKANSPRRRVDFTDGSKGASKARTARSGNREDNATKAEVHLKVC